MTDTTLTKDEIRAALDTLIGNGLTFDECVKVFGIHTQFNPYGRHADGVIARAGKIEIDSRTVVSESDDGGAYVMAWLWVADSDVWGGPIDTNGDPCRTRNHFHCELDGATWSVDDSAECTDLCPGCGRELSPTLVQELDLWGEPIAQDA